MRHQIRGKTSPWLAEWIEDSTQLRTRKRRSGVSSNKKVAMLSCVALQQSPLSHIVVDLIGEFSRDWQFSPSGFYTRLMQTRITRVVGSSNNHNLIGVEVDIIYS